MQIVLRRSNSDGYEFIGYGVGEFKPQEVVDFGDEGCMTSYSVGFANEKLRFLKAISNPTLQKQLDNY